jgi:hypothetical protein
VAGKRDKRKRQEARRRAHLDRVAATNAGAARDGVEGTERRRREREAAARTASIGPSAARWLVADTTDEHVTGRPVDVVADLLALDPRTRLRGRGDAELRTLAGHVEALVQMGAAAPSGRLLVEVLVPDADARAALEPSLDLDALLGDGPVSDRSHDRTVRLAEAMLERAAAHREGEVDLHALVAPVGVDRHPVADELEVIVAVAVEHVPLPANPEPAVVVTTGGWVAASPVELFLAAARGLLDGRAAEVAGAALYAWLERVGRDPLDPWWSGLSTIVDVDAPALLQQAAARAGSDHPDVAGGVLVELVSLRHPLL